jgi:hypothetical protein
LFRCPEKTVRGLLKGNFESNSEKETVDYPVFLQWRLKTVNVGAIVNRDYFTYLAAERPQQTRSKPIQS